MRTDNNRVRDAICPPVSDRLSSSSTTHTATGISFQRQPEFKRNGWTRMVHVPIIQSPVDASFIL